MSEVKIIALEKEILEALESTLAEAPYEHEQFNEEEVKAAARVCLRWIEKALRDGSDPVFTDSNGNLMKRVQDLYVREWLKENGLILSA